MYTPNYHFNFPLIILFCTISIISSCTTTPKKEKVNQNKEIESGVSNIPHKYKSPNEVYKRDSLFISETVKEFIKKNVSPFHYYNTFHIPLDKIIIDVDSIFYSPDQLKLFSFVIVTSPNGANSNLDEVNYSGNSLIGYRPNAKTFWTIYNFDQFSTGGFKKYNSIRKLFRDYYLGNGKFRNDQEYIWDSKSQDRISVKFGYNLDESNFWDSSLVWRKGARIPNHYNFQTIGNIKPNEENPLKIMPHFDYPESLLNMYK